MIVGEIDRVERIARDKEPPVGLLADPRVLPGGAIDTQERFGNLADRRDARAMREPRLQPAGSIRASATTSDPRK